MNEKQFLEMQDKELLLNLKSKYDIGKTYYGALHKKMRLLNSTDNGDLWKALGAKFPSYQLLPDTNMVSYVKNNILASLYTVTKSAQVIATCEDDVEPCERLNVALEHEWDFNNIGYYQFKAGERAALLNLGLTHVSWDKDKDKIAFKNVDPLRFMRDPFTETLEDSSWCLTYNAFPKSFFQSNALYKDAFKIIKNKNNLSAHTSTESLPEYVDRPNAVNSDKHYNLFIWHLKRKGKLMEIHTLNNEVILYKVDDVKPNKFPYAELYCNLPGASIIGSSEPAKIFANNVVFNLMDSIAFTAEYKNQRPPKFVNSQSGLNIKAFAKHGNEADRTFIVNGDASKATHYHQFPTPSPTLPSMQQNLQHNMQLTSGVDGRYTGRDTGSIITTGGTEEMLNRVTLIDTPKILNYERYTRTLTDLVLNFLIEFAPKRNYLVKDDTKKEAVYNSVELDFPTYSPKGVFDYVIQISSELPKNKQRVQAWANNMMEKQMQYQQQGNAIDIITPEEWIRCLDVPYKEQMLKRMGVQAGLNAYLEAENTINEYATLLEQGVIPEDAMAMAAQGLDNLRKGNPTPLQESMGPEMGAFDQMSEMPV